jgi:hypothetical protein
VGRDVPSPNVGDTVVEHGSGTDFTRVSSPDPDPTFDSLKAVTTRSGVSWAVGQQRYDWPRTLIEYRR